MIYWLEILKRSNSVGVILVLSVLITFMGLLSPIFIIHIFNRYITFGLEGTLYFLIIGALLVASFEFFFRNLRNQIFEQVIKWPIKSAKLEIFNRSFDVPGLSKQKIIDVLDLNNNVQKFLSSQNQSNIIDSFFLIFILIFLFFLNFKLAIIFISIVLIYLFFQRQSNLKKKKLSILNKLSSDDRLIVKDLVENFDLLNYLNAKKYVNFFLEKYHDKQQDNDITVSSINNYSISYNNFIILVCSIIIIGFGSTLVVSGELSIGALIGFNIFSSRALIIASSAQRSYFSLILINDYIVKYKKVLNQSINTTEKLKLNRIIGEIEIKDLDFSYEKSNFYLFKNISFKAFPGTVLNISGSNGTGKTTLAKIILGILTPSNGEIFIDKTNILKLSSNWWKKQIGFVPQNSELINSSIKDNILLANEKLNQQEISRLLETVGLGDNLKKSNLSFNDVIQDNLSKGLKKKVHYARILSINPQIYIFDEPFGDMDKNGKEMVIKLLTSLKKSNKTIITLTDDSLIKEVSDKTFKLGESS